tara:strand:+ start:137 stop:490 length:354 start_codon:yes stop_codon:yes gene_type:complete
MQETQPETKVAPGDSASQCESQSDQTTTDPVSFEYCAEQVSLLKSAGKKLNDNDMLALYSYYKQATEGDNQNDKPGLFRFVELQKWKSWDKIKGLTREEARTAYVALAQHIQSEYGV